MALKDLAADLKNFRYGISSPDKVDNQIKNGVDFFDDNEGGATGFTPKTDLESLYHKVQNGTVAAPNAGVVENNKTRSAYGSDGEYGLSSFVTENSQYLANPRFIVSSDRIAGVRNQPQFLSPFLDLPIADYVSQYPKEPSITWGLGVDEDGLPIDGTMLGPVGPKVQPFHISDFMTVPLEDRLTRFPNSDGNMPEISLTFKNDVLEFTGPVGKKDTIVKLINDKRRGFYDHIITPTKDHQPFPVNVNSNLDLYNPTYDRYFNEMNGNSIHISPNGELKAGRGYNSVFFAGVNNGITIVDTFSAPFSMNNTVETNLYPIQYATEQSTTAQKQIFKISQKIGLASPPSSQDLIQIANLNQQLSQLISTPPNTGGFGGAAIGLADPPFNNYNAQIAEIQNQISLLEAGTAAGDSISFTQSTSLKITPTKSNAKQKSFFNEGYGKADYLSDKNLGPVSSFIFQPTFAPLSLASLFNDNKDSLYGGDNFDSVPSGLNINNFFGTKRFRSVSDPGKFNHPLILREIGNKWGMDSLGDNPISEAIGGLVRGAPGITGLMSRSLNDKFRIGKFMFNTSDGIAFVLKQTTLQALNPTLESKIYNPLSTLGLVGAGDAFDAVKGLFGGGINGLFKLDTYKTAIKGLAKFAASALLDIGQPERHLLGGRYYTDESNNVLGTLQIPNFAKTLLGVPYPQQKATSGRLASAAVGLASLSPDEEEGILPKSNISFGGSKLAKWAAGKVNDKLNEKIDEVNQGADFAKALPFFMAFNPNRYVFPFSSAPKSIGKDGSISFVGGTDLALRDIIEISDKGWTFNNNTLFPNIHPFSVKAESLNLGDANKSKRRSKLYGELNETNSYEKLIKQNGENITKSKFHYTKNKDGLEDLIPKPPRSEFEGKRGDFTLEEKVGGNFNPQTAANDKLPGHLEGRDILTRHNTFPYDEIKYENRYEQSLESPSDRATISKDDFDAVIEQRIDDKAIARDIGVLNNFVTKQRDIDLDLIKKGTDATLKSDNTDKVNMTPITSNKNVATQHPDFIKFMFRDVINNKYLVFRAIVDGITDTITPEYGEVKYIGRPDKLYNYQGTERSVSFNFKIYPKTKQELPVLMEKVNYLVGLCYPSYTSKERMVTPFVELTLGDMFNDTPGLLESVTVTVEDATTWEIDKGLQFPHFISCQCTFKYIGKAENVPVALGKFYDISWLKGDNRIGEVGAPIGTFANSEDDNPLRINSEGNGSFEYINGLNNVPKVVE